MKLAWGIVAEKDSLWVQVLRAKYSNGNDPILSLKTNAKQSATQKGIRTIWDRFVNNIQWVISNNLNIRFQVDKWMERCIALKDYMTGHFPQSWSSIKLCNMVDQWGNYKWSEFQHLIPLQVTLKIATMWGPNQTAYKDFVIWKPSSNSEFSSISAYHSLENDKWNYKEKLWSLIWDWGGMP